jgi:hypothetical protein
VLHSLVGDSCVDLPLLHSILTSSFGSHLCRVIKKFNECAAPNRRLKTSIICALSHSEAITTRKTKPYKLLWYCRGLSTVTEAITTVGLPVGTTIEDMFRMASQANLKTPVNKGECTIKEEAEAVESTIEKMRRDGEKEREGSRRGLDEDNDRDDTKRPTFSAT